MTIDTAKPPCIKCGYAVRVVDSRLHADGITHRKQRCTHCGNAFHTVEIRRDTYLHMKMLVEEFTTVKHLLRK